jgi:hypothetical protein
LLANANLLLSSASPPVRSPLRILWFLVEPPSAKDTSLWVEPLSGQRRARVDAEEERARAR